MTGLLFKTSEYTFLDHKLFEDLPLPGFEDIPNGYDIEERLVAAAPVLAKLPPDDTLFEWLLRRINHLSSGRLTLDDDHGDEGYFPLSILVTRGANPIAVLDFEGDNYGIECYVRATDTDGSNDAVAAFVAACAANPKQTRKVSLLGDD
jgi:hypothetical protein